MQQQKQQKKKKKQLQQKRSGRKRKQSLKGKEHLEYLEYERENSDSTTPPPVISDAVHVGDDGDGEGCANLWSGGAGSDEQVSVRSAPHSQP